MNKVFLYFLLFSFQLQLAFAGTEKHAADFSFTKKENSSLIEFNALPPQGAHFNVEAPVKAQMGSETIKPKTITKTAISFSLEKNKIKADSITLSAYLCDDGNTFCEEHQVKLPLKNTASADKPIHILEKNKNETIITTKTTFDKSGFITNNPEAGFAKAKKENKPLLLDFYAIWCPPCNMMDKELFSKSDFKNETKNFVKVKIDVDKNEYADLKAKYKVRAYPTYIFATPDGEVINQAVGFVDKKKFYQLTQSALENKTQGYSSLLAKADSGDQTAKDRIGRILIEQGEFALAEKYLKDSKQYQQDYYDAQLQQLDDEDKARIPLLVKAIQAAPQTPMAIEYRQNLAELYEKNNDKEKAKQALEEAIQFSEQCINNIDCLNSSRYSYTQNDIKSIMADIYSKLNQKDKATVIWKEIIASIKSHKNLDRSDIMDLTYDLNQIGEFDEAAKYYKQMQKKYPYEFTFYYRHAKQLFKNKKVDEALTLALNSYKYSYGENKFTVANLLGDIYIELKQPDEAKKIWSDLITETKLPDDKKTRIYKLVTNLKKKLDSIEK